MLMSWMTVVGGNEIERHPSVDLDDILYSTFQAVTCSMAADRGLHRRLEGQDFRRVLWTKQFELLDALNPVSTARRCEDLGHLLAQVGL
jgi:Immunity protein 63